MFVFVYAQMFCQLRIISIIVYVTAIKTS